MAANSTNEQSITFTLSGTTADTVTVAGNDAPWLEFVNLHSTEWAHARADGTTAVADAAGTFPIAPNGGSTIVMVQNGSLGSVVGNGNKIKVLARAAL